MSASTFRSAHRCSGTRLAAPELDPEQIGFGKRRVCAGQLSHRKEVDALRNALAAAHGENLGLRRRLAQLDG